MRIITALLGGFIADCFFGDPHFMPHPVRVMGWMISKGEKLLRKNSAGSARNFVAGMLLSLFVTAVSFAVPFVFLLYLYKINFICGITAEIFMCYQIFAAKSLRDESMKVYHELKKGDTEKARLFLSYIVGRDTENLDHEQISKAAVETVAENLSDGVVAPMIFMFIGGAPAGLAYKAVNTLDSMIGYNDERYAFFGKFAARLDDAANFIPSRISAVLMIAGAFVCGMDAKQAVKIFIRDRYNHKSPNSAQTESVCAGALGISLSGDNYYKGVLVKKPKIGDGARPAVMDDIIKANRLMYASAVICLIFGLTLRFFI